MKAEEILNKLKIEDKDKLYQPYIFEEDYAGGSREYIREDICEKAIELSRQSLLKELIGEIEKEKAESNNGHMIAALTKVQVLLTSKLNEDGAH